jgi:dephospho-CoA kinase
MVVVGITGGIASGKSLVAQQFGQWGALVLDADRIGHEVLGEEAVRAALVARWGVHILDAAGHVSRAAVAAHVFAAPPRGPAELAFLEGLTHPRITARMEDRLQETRRSGAYRVVVLDAPVLHKAGWDAYCDVLLFVDADDGARLARARQRGWDERQWRAREAAQPDLAYQRARADVILDNGGSPAELLAQASQVWSSLQSDEYVAIFRKQPFTNGQENP